MTTRSLIILGLDGLSYEVTKKWIKKGYLPTLGFIKEKGSFGVLESTIPAATSPALPTMYTGKNPAKHGIFGFLKADDTVNRFTLLEDKTLWNILSENDKKVFITNLRTTYPPDKVNGVMISGGMLMPSENNDFVYPPYLKSELRGFHKRPDLSGLNETREKILQNQKLILKKIFECFKNQYNIFKKIYDNSKFNFTIYWIGFTDNIQHLAWNNEKLMLKYFRKVDKIVQNIIENSKEINIIIVSDHGFEKAPERNFYVNAWLEDEGYLSTRGGKVGRRLLSRAYNLGGKLPKKHLKKALSLLKKGKKEKGQEEKSKLPDHKNLPGINLNKTVAYLHQKWGVGIIQENLGNRDYETVREELMEKLKHVEVNGEKPVKAVWKKEEIFSGKYLDQVPDIIFLTSENYDAEYSLSAKVIAEKNPKPAIVGYHDTAREGVIMGIGPDIKQGKVNASILDITPTVLHYFGIPVDRDMDGRVLKEIFREDSEVYKREVKYKKYGSKETEEKEVYSREDEEKIKERLKSLGYMD